MLSSNEWLSDHFCQLNEWFRPLRQKDFCLIAAVSGAFCTEQRAFFAFLFFLLLLLRMFECVLTALPQQSHTKEKMEAPGAFLSPKGVPWAALRGCAELLACSGSLRCGTALGGHTGSSAEARGWTWMALNWDTSGSTGCLRVCSQAGAWPPFQECPQLTRGSSKSWKLQILTGACQACMDKAEKWGILQTTKVWF